LDALAVFVAAGSRAAAAATATQLRAADVAATLRRLSEFDGPAGVVIRTQRLYGLMAAASGAFRADVLEAAAGAVLTGVLLYAGAGAACVAAAEKLCAAVDGLPGREFAALCGDAAACAAGARVPCALEFAHGVISRAAHMEGIGAASAAEDAVADPRLMEACGQVHVQKSQNDAQALCCVRGVHCCFSSLAEC
jgi:hypothetical protein